MDGISFVGRIVTDITGNPDCFDLSKSLDERGVLLTLSVDNAHMGRVIGKSGSTALAIRTLLISLGQQNGARYSLKIEKRGDDES